MTKNRTQGPIADNEAEKDVENDAGKATESAPAEDVRTEVKTDVDRTNLEKTVEKVDEEADEKADATSDKEAEPVETAEPVVATDEKSEEKSEGETDGTEGPRESDSPPEALEKAETSETSEDAGKSPKAVAPDMRDAPAAVENSVVKTEKPARSNSPSFARRLLKGCLVAAVLLAILAVGGFFGLRHYVNTVPVPVTVKTATVDVMVEEGDGARRIIAKMREAGLEVEDWSLRAASRLHTSGMGRIHAGLYRFPAGVTRTGILDLLARGPVIDQQLRIPDGATIWEVRAIFAEGVNLKPVTRGMSEEELKSALGLSDYPSLEGFFAPDTYRYGSGTTDLAVMKQAVARQKRLLDEAWASRSAEVAVRTPYEALILASIVEKETGERSDRHLVSSVFHNRMKVGMPLQTDPTVIYGLGPAWRGRLTKQDLRSDTPYNTYRIPGLPPTPISMPTPASIEAAVHPAASRYLYFVSRGDGTSEFTTNLKDHNAAVRHFILRKQTTPLNLPKAADEKGPLRAQ